MARSLVTATLKCSARVHAIVVDRRFLRIRCTDGHCPDVQHAKATRQRAYHVFDLHGEVEDYTDYEPNKQRLTTHKE